MSCAAAWKDVQLSEVTVNCQTDSHEVVHSFRDDEDDLTNQAERFRGRTEVIHKDIRNGKASLLLKNIVPNDMGTYHIYFFHHGGYEHCIFHLQVPGMSV